MALVITGCERSSQKDCDKLSDDFFKEPRVKEHNLRDFFKQGVLFYGLFEKRVLRSEKYRRHSRGIQQCVANAQCMDSEMHRFPRTFQHSSDQQFLPYPLDPTTTNSSMNKHRLIPFVFLVIIKLTRASSDLYDVHPIGVTRLESCESILISCVVLLVSFLFCCSSSLDLREIFDRCRPHQRSFSMIFLVANDGSQVPFEVCFRHWKFHSSDHRCAPLVNTDSIIDNRLNCCSFNSTTEFSS